MPEGESEDGMMKVKRTERGWSGHFIGGRRCLFRRNTLLECRDERIVISTVGAFVDHNGVVQTIGHNRWYETMAFKAKFKEGYWEAAVTEEIDFKSPWGLFAESWNELVTTYPLIDNVANDMHEAVVAELTEKLESEGE